MQQRKIVDLRNIKKSFLSGKDTLIIINDLNLIIEQGNTVVVTGKSGAGKSTLLHLIGGLDHADRGAITIANNALHTMTEEQLSYFRNTQIGFIFQSHYLLNDFNAIENIMLPAFVRGISRRTVYAQAMQLLQAVDLENRAFHYPNQLSGGEQQRITVARALINSPTIILADEPTGNLDEEKARLLETMLFVLVKKFKKTLVLVTHDSGIAKRADIHYHLSHGKLVRQ